LGDQIKKNEMCRACSTYGGEGRHIQGCGGGGDLREGDHLEDSGIDGRVNIKMDLQELGWGLKLD
jgi:hypothetical protein